MRAGADSSRGVLEAAAERVGPGFSAAVGPGAGACCYAVGEDVAAPLRARFGDDVVADGRADLAACARRALERAGAADVAVAGLCTICDAERFHSHRRDGRGQRPAGRHRLSWSSRERRARGRAGESRRRARRDRRRGAPLGPRAERRRAAGGGEVRGARGHGDARRRGHRARRREPRRAAAGQAGGRARPLRVGLHRPPAEPQGARPRRARAARALALDALGRRAARPQQRDAGRRASSRSTSRARNPRRDWRRRPSTSSSRRSPRWATSASRGS